MSQQLATLMPLILLIVIMYFLLIRPQKKREKSVAAMRNSVKVGDEIITIGGICGKVVKTKDEVLTIQVGADRVKFEIMRWAVSKVVNDESAPSPSKKAKQEEPQDEDKIEAPKKTLPKRMKKAGDMEASSSDAAPEPAAESEADATEATDNK